MARPTLYNEEILKKTQEYIDSCGNLSVIAEVPFISTQEISNPSTTGGPFKQTVQEVGTRKEVQHVIKIPSIEGLSYFLKVHKDTLYEWRKEHPEFSDLIGELLAKQGEMLINGGTSGKYNPTIAKVLLSKHGYREETKVEGETKVILLDE